MKNSLDAHSAQTTEPVRTLSVDGAELTLLPKQAYCAQLTQRCDSYGFAFDPQTGQHAMASSRVSDFHTHANTLAFLPAGCDVYSESMNGGEYLKLSFTHHHRAPSLTGPLPTAPINGIYHTEAIGAAHALRKILLQTTIADSFEVERWINKLSEYFQPNDQSIEPPNSQFSRQRKIYLEEFIESHLSEKLTVKLLAHNCQLSEAYFARCFKNTFKRSPHDYVVERRLSKARTALQRNKNNLMDIALDAGFSSHAHMSYVFQQKLGIAPSRFRQ